MIEIPEAVTIAGQIAATLHGKRIAEVEAAHSPHRWAWYFGDPAAYAARLTGKTMDGARAVGGMVEARAGDAVLLFGDGAILRTHEPSEERPRKHQLLIGFEDGFALSAAVQMYGGVWCFPDGQMDNPYYDAARQNPSPLTDQFDRDYFGQIVSSARGNKLSAKGLLATEQRIPGLGNGTLQDILLAAGIHPKRKVDTLEEPEEERLFHAVKHTLAEMTRLGGRDTERDLFGNPGGYKTKLSKNTVGGRCPECGSVIRKEAYMGGSIYFCPGCQPVCP